MKVRLTRRVNHGPIIQIYRPPLRDRRIAGRLFINVAQHPQFSIFVGRHMFRITRFITKEGAILRDRYVGRELSNEACLTTSRRNRVMLRMVMIQSTCMYLSVSTTQIRKRRANAGRRLMMASKVRQNRGNIFLPFPARCKRLLQNVRNFLCFDFNNSNFLRGTMTIKRPRNASRGLIRLLLNRARNMKDFLNPFLFLRRMALRFLRVLYRNVLNVLLRAQIRHNVSFRPINMRIMFNAIFLNILFTPSGRQIILPIR